MTHKEIKLLATVKGIQDTIDSVMKIYQIRRNTPCFSYGDIRRYKVSA